MYDPAWVFPRKLKRGWVAIGNAISHESGHLLMLGHDGRGRHRYFQGNRSWAPIMGYPGTHWIAKPIHNKILLCGRIVDLDGEPPLIVARTRCPPPAG